MPTARPLSAKVAKSITYRVALCGAGPAGLSALRALEHKWQSRSSDKGRLHVDVFDASLVPGGLIRTGVAPDNQAIKEIGTKLIQHVQTLREEQNDPASVFSFEYFGGVEVGKWLSLRAIRHAYDSVLMTTGIPNSASEEKPAIGLAHEWNPGVACSKEIVKLYNGHPLTCPSYLYDLYGRVPGVMAEAGQWTVDSKLLDYSLARSSSVTSRDGSNLSRRELASFGNVFDPARKEKNIIILGQGNVALDIARVLLTPPSELPRKEVPKYSRKLLRAFHEGVNADVHICGRRGALQAAWDTASLREVFTMGEGVKVMVRPEELTASLNHPTIAKELRRSRVLQRMAALLEEGALNSQSKGVDKHKVWLRFLLHPTELKLNANESRWTGIVRRVEFDRNILTKMKAGSKDVADIEAVHDKKHLTREVIDDVCLVVKSMGFGRSEKPLWKYFESPAPPHTLHPLEKEVTKSARKIVSYKHKTPKSLIFPRDETSAPVYMAGWLRSGGTGNLMSTMSDAKNVSEEILGELISECAEREAGDGLLADLLCLRATVPEIGIPIDWDEAIRLLETETATGEKLCEWKKAADIVNGMREARGPRSERWQDQISRLKPRCLAHPLH